MNDPVSTRIIVSTSPFPYNFIPKIILTKDLIQQNLDIMANMPIQMDINACRIAHHGFDCHQILVHPVEIVLLVPDIAVHLLLERPQFLDIQFAFSLTNGLGNLGVASQIDLLGIIGTAGKGRINIDQIHGDSFVLQIGAGRQTLSANNEIAVRIVFPALSKLGLVKRQTAFDALDDPIVVAIAKQPFGAYKIVENSLTFQRVREIRDVFDCHNRILFINC